MDLDKLIEEAKQDLKILRKEQDERERDDWKTRLKEFSWAFAIMAIVVIVLYIVGDRFFGFLEVIIKSVLAVFAVIHFVSMLAEDLQAPPRRKKKRKSRNKKSASKREKERHCKEEKDVNPRRITRKLRLSRRTKAALKKMEVAYQESKNRDTNDES